MSSVIKTKQLVACLATRAFSALGRLLRNGNRFDLSREEVRSFRVSYSQFGEDLYIQNIFNELGIHQGLYVDVGAFHPVYLSNTLLLHKKGWRGVNIDMNQSKIDCFVKERPDDVNICQSIGLGGQGVAEEIGTTRERICLVEEIAGVMQDDLLRLKSLNDVLLEQFDGKRKRIDFLNIDCEGHDLDVLLSLDVAIWQPIVVAIESLEPDQGIEIRKALNLTGYTLKAEIGLTLIFVRELV